MENKLKATEEQLSYAGILDIGMKVGLLVLIITFIIYMLGILTPFVGVKDVSKYWELRVTDYLYVLSKVEAGKEPEALELINSCKAAATQGRGPEECKEIIEEGHKYAGWAWLGMLGKADFLNFVPIAFLAGVTILCYIRIVPILFRKKDSTYAVLAIAEVLILVLAASGVLKAGGH